MGRDLGREDLPAQSLERGQGAGLVLAHEPRVASHVGRHDRGEPAFGAVPRHDALPGLPMVADGSLGERGGRVQPPSTGPQRCDVCQFPAR